MAWSFAFVLRLALAQPPSPPPETPLKTPWKSTTPTPAADTDKRRHPSVFNIFHLFFTCYLLAHSALPLFPVRPHPPDLWEPAFLVDKHLSLTGAKLACVQSPNPLPLRPCCHCGCKLQVVPRATLFAANIFCRSVAINKKLALLLPLAAVSCC